MDTMTNGYDCKAYEDDCTSDKTSQWSMKVRAACKNTCSRLASDYCNQNTCDLRERFNLRTVLMNIKQSLLGDIILMHIHIDMINIY